MPNLSWDEIIAGGKYVGGDLEFTNTEHFVHRGPIKEIRREGDMIYIELDWVAILDPSAGEWATPPPEVEPLFNHLADWSRPNAIGGGRVSYSMPMVGRGTLIPKGGSKLDRSKVADRVYDPLAL